MKHLAQHGGWTRKYEYDSLSNQLESTSVPGDDMMLGLRIKIKLLLWYDGG